MDVHIKCVLSPVIIHLVWQGALRVIRRDDMHGGSAALLLDYHEAVVRHRDLLKPP
jgi:hypothetical protein